MLKIIILNQILVLKLKNKMKFLKKLTKFNENIGTILSEGLSSMQMFYIVTFCVVCPLLVERPNSLILWIQYLSHNRLPFVGQSVDELVNFFNGSYIHAARGFVKNNQFWLLNQ